MGHTFLDTLEEGVVRFTRSCLLVWVVLQNLLSECLFDLLVVSVVSILGETQDSIMILGLPLTRIRGEQDWILFFLIFGELGITFGGTSVVLNGLFDKRVVTALFTVEAMITCTTGRNRLRVKL
jgi:L-lactate permease